MPIRTPVSIYAAVLLVLFSGCLPYSCRREEATALTPADSVSRAIAGGVPADSLDLVWSADRHLEYPRTVRYAAGGNVAAGDVERDAVLFFDPQGAFLREITGLAVPYVAGFRGDTLAVFSPGELAVHLIASGEDDVNRTVFIQDAERSGRDLVYAAYTGEIFYKRVDANASGFLARVDPSGRISDRLALTGPQWRHAGLLKAWGDTLLSLSGYRPVVDYISPVRGPLNGIDTLGLRGFDSPMLPRSRAFMLGEVDEAPLLTTSAAAAGDYLFVLNIRAGWLQVDVFDRQGLLQRRLVERAPAYRKAFYPQDLDVRRRASGTYEIVVALSEPAAEVRLYAWTPGGVGGPSGAPSFGEASDPVKSGGRP